MKRFNLIVLIISIAFFQSLAAFETKNTTFAVWNNSDVELFYALPEEINNQTQVLFIIHGGARDSEKYLSAVSKDFKSLYVIAMLDLVFAILFKSPKFMYDANDF